VLVRENIEQPNAVSYHSDKSGTPFATRLLDCTLSPWVACYFAAQEYRDEDAAIWTFNRDELDKANYSHRQSRSRDFARFSELASARTVEDWAWSAIRAGPYIGTFRYEYANPQMVLSKAFYDLGATGRRP
jgi:hypothetical protein